MFVGRYMYDVPRYIHLGTCNYNSFWKSNSICLSNNIEMEATECSEQMFYYQLTILHTMYTGVELPIVKGECSLFKKLFLLWMKTIHYPNTIRSHLVTIVPMAPFTPKSTSKLRSALHIRYSKVTPRFISRANTAQT